MLFRSVRAQGFGLLSVRASVTWLQIFRCGRYYSLAQKQPSPVNQKQHFEVVFDFPALRPGFLSLTAHTNKKKPPLRTAFFIGTRAGIRTLDPLIKSN